MEHIKMIFYAIISRLIPNKVVAFCLVRFINEDENIKVIDVFDRLTKE